MQLFGEAVHPVKVARENAGGVCGVVLAEIAGGEGADLIDIAVDAAEIIGVFQPGFVNQGDEALRFRLNGGGVFLALFFQPPVSGLSGRFLFLLLCSFSAAA